MGHPKTTTTVQTYNYKAEGIINMRTQQKIKSNGHGFYWVRDQVGKNIFRVFGIPGKTNRGDYFTENNPYKHLCETRPVLLIRKIQEVKGRIVCVCVDMSYHKKIKSI